MFVMRLMIKYQQKRTAGRSTTDGRKSGECNEVYQLNNDRDQTNDVQTLRIDSPAGQRYT